MNRNRFSLHFHSTTQPLIDRQRRFMWKPWSINKSKKSKKWNKAPRLNQHQRPFKRKKSDTKKLVSLILAFINSKTPAERKEFSSFYSTLWFFPLDPFSTPCFFSCHPQNPLHSPKKYLKSFMRRREINNRLLSRINENIGHNCVYPYFLPTVEVRQKLLPIKRRQGAQNINPYHVELKLF